MEERGGGRTGGAGEKLVQDDLYGVEPVQRLRLGAVCDFTSVSLAEIPQPNLVEVVQAQCAGYAVDQGRLRYGLGDYVAQVELHEVDAPHDGFRGGRVADFDEDEEDEGDEEEEGG